MSSQPSNPVAPKVCAIETEKGRRGSLAVLCAKLLPDDHQVKSQLIFSSAIPQIQYRLECWEA